MITEIFVENQKLDVNADISSLLTFAIDDVKDFSSRSTTYSKTIVLPGTANNNAIFGNIFETGISNDYDPSLPNIGYNFNPAISARCIVFQDNLQTFKGTIRLLQIVKDLRRIEYEVALNGDLTSLNVALSSGYLSQLDFSAYNQLYTVANITASWDAAPGSGVYFPLIDYGNYSIDKHNWDFHTFRPALFVKDYLDKMFAAANFRYSCDLFNTDRFKRLIIPHNQKVLLSKVSQVLSAKTIDMQTFTLSFGGYAVKWDSFLGGGFSYSAGIFTYTQATTLVVSTSWLIRGFIQTAPVGGTVPTTNFSIRIRKNALVVASKAFTATMAYQPFKWTSSINLSFATGDQIDIQLFLEASSPHSDITLTGGNTLTLGSNIPTLQPVSYGQNITLNDALPQNIRQVDFLVSIVKLFNLYVVESQFDDRLILITPFIDFYSTASNSAVDWTQKINRDAPIQITPLSELNSKLYQFNYKADSDYFNDVYQKRYNQGYGSHIFDAQFEFASQTNKLELIFASTPLVGYLGEAKVYPTILKRTGNVAGEGEEQIDSVIRIMQTKKVLGVPTWTVQDNTTVTPANLGTYDKYGYAGHLDDPDNPSNDLNFGALKELFFILATGDLSKTQFNVYWSSYMAEITDKDSKMLIAKFYLSAKDIFELSFSKYVYVDGAIFRLNKITDYNATLPSDCEVQLLKVINTSYSFIPVGPPVGDNQFLLWNDTDPLINSDTQEILYQ